MSRVKLLVLSLLVLLLFVSAGPNTPQVDPQLDPRAGTTPARALNPVYFNAPFDAGHDWLQFDGTALEGSPGQTQAVSRANVRSLRVEWRVQLPFPEIVDGSPVYVGEAVTPDGPVDMLIVTTTAGRLMAVNAHVGHTIWNVDPRPGPRWTTSSPAVDPNRQFVYSYALDGYVHKYWLRSGEEVIDGGWPELITLKGQVEKGSSALTIATARNGHSYLYTTIAAYPEPGDDGDYQGHLVVIDLESGAQNIFNAACSDKAFHFVENGDDTNDCAHRQSGIWARSGVTYDQETDRIFVTTGNGVYDADQGGFNWGTSIVALRPDGSLDRGAPLDSYTPVNYQNLTDQDLDLSSTAVAILPRTPGTEMPRLGVQSGKDWLLRLVNLNDLSGKGGPRHTGGELQIVKVSQGGEVLTRPATWLDPGSNQSWIFVANTLGISAYSLTVTAAGQPRLVARWRRKDAGASPIVVNGVLYYAGDNVIRALDPRTGDVLWQNRTIAKIHWASPILVNGTLYIADTSGFMTAFAIDTRH